MIKMNPCCTIAMILPFGTDMNQLFCLILLKNQHTYAPVRKMHFGDQVKEIYVISLHIYWFFLQEEVSLEKIILNADEYSYGIKGIRGTNIVSLLSWTVMIFASTKKLDRCFSTILPCSTITERWWIRFLNKLLVHQFQVLKSVVATSASYIR